MSKLYQSHIFIQLMFSDQLVYDICWTLGIHNECRDLHSSRLHYNRGDRHTHTHTHLLMTSCFKYFKDFFLKRRGEHLETERPEKARLAN